MLLSFTECFSCVINETTSEKEHETMRSINREKLAEDMLSLGANPSYRAFGYIIYLLTHNSIDQILMMNETEILMSVSNRFHISVNMIKRSFKRYMRSFRRNGKGGSLLSKSMPKLTMNELPTVKEFVLIIACNTDEAE